MFTLLPLLRFLCRRSKGFLLELLFHIITKMMVFRLNVIGKNYARSEEGIIQELIWTNFPNYPLSAYHLE